MKQFPNNEITVDIDCFCTIKTVMVTYQPDHRWRNTENWRNRRFYI